jgi:hypothetical protein
MDMKAYGAGLVDATLAQLLGNDRRVERLEPQET